MMVKIAIIFLACLLSGCGDDYHDSLGNSQTKEEHAQMLAHDAALNVAIDHRNLCKNNPSNSECP